MSAWDWFEQEEGARLAFIVQMEAERLARAHDALIKRELAAAFAENRDTRVMRSEPDPFGRVWTFALAPADQQRLYL